MTFLEWYIAFSLVVLFFTVMEEIWFGNNQFSILIIMVMIIASFTPVFNAFGMCAMLYNFVTGGYKKKIRY